jgi:hypothetical protein
MVKEPHRIRQRNRGTLTSPRKEKGGLRQGFTGIKANQNSVRLSSKKFRFEKLFSYLNFLVDTPVPESYKSFLWLTSRLLKNAYLRRSPHPSSLRRTGKYASLLWISGALDLDVFEQPVSRDFFRNLLDRKPVSCSQAAEKF